MRRIIYLAGLVTALYLSLLSLRRTGPEIVAAALLLSALAIVIVMLWRSRR